MGQSAGFDRSNVPQGVSALYVQLREAHTRDGWDTGGQYVADRHHATVQERVAACEQRPVQLRWMTPLCDSMLNTFSDVYGCVHCLRVAACERQPV